MWIQKLPTFNLLKEVSLKRQILDRFYLVGT